METSVGGMRSTRRRLLGTGRSIAGGLVGIAGGAALAACGGASPGATADGKLAPSKGAVTVVPFLSGFTDAMRGDWDTQIAAVYKQRHPNITVDLVPQTGPTVERVQKMTALMAAGSPLDLGDGPLGLRAMVAQNLADPAIEALIKRDKYETKKYNQAHFEAGATLEGKTLALPYRYGGNVMCLACNVNLFKEAGVALPPGDVGKPWTWEEFVTALTRLTNRAGGDVSQFGLAGHGWIVGSWPPLWKADWISPDLKTITCDTKEMQDCYTRVGELFTRHHVVPQPGEAARLFGTANVFNSGKAAILLFPPTGWRTYGIGAEVDYAFAPMPKVVQSVPDMGSGGISLYTGSKVTGDAWDLLKFLIEESRYAKLIGLMPAVVADIEPWAKGQLQRVPSADTRVLQSIVERAGTGSSLLSQHTKYADMTNVMNPILDDFMAGKLVPLDMLRSLKSQLQTIIDAG
jgi:ABC-type glycerol-3-phosphate transport system substrate-binding protein